MERSGKGLREAISGQPLSSVLKQAGRTPSPRTRRLLFRPASAYVPLMVVLAAMSAGIVADRYSGIPLGLWTLLAGGGLTGWLACWTWKRDRLACAGLLVAVAAGGGAWHHLWWRLFNPWEMARYATGPATSSPGSLLTEGHFPTDSESQGVMLPEAAPEGDGQSWPDRWPVKPVALEATVLSTPYAVPLSSTSPWHREKNLRRFRFVAAVCRIRHRSQWRPASGRVLVWVAAHRLEDLTGRFGLGDRIRIFGQLGRIPPPANPGQYDFADLMRSYRVLCTLSCSGPECIELIYSAAWYRPDRLLDAFRRYSAARFLQDMPNPQRKSLPNRQREWAGEASGADRSEEAAARQVADAVVADAAESGASAIAQLAATILLGLREELPPDYTEPFVRTGTVHLLAISGFHVGMVMVLVGLLMRVAGAGQKVEMVVVAGACLAYMFLSGARPATVRAVVLVELACLAAVAGRRPFGWNTLAAAGLIILTLNPTELFRLGTQLSFLSVGALFLLVPEGRLPRLTPPKPPGSPWYPAPGWLRHLQQRLGNQTAPQGQKSAWQLVRRWMDSVGTWLGPLDATEPLDRLILHSMSRTERCLRWLVRTIGFMVFAGAAIWAVVTPLVMARMHLCPLSGLLLNVPACFATMGAMISGGLFLIAGWIWTPLGRLLAGFCYFCLKFLTGLIDWAAEWPGSYFWTPGPASWWLAGFYGGLAAWLVWLRRRWSLRWAVAALGVWIALGLWANPILQSLRRSEPGQWECAFLSVGHGLAVVLHLPDGQTWLYDAGSVGPPERTAELIAGYLWSRGIRRLNTVFLSHADQDHYNALPELMERISIDRVIMPSRMLRQIGQLGRAEQPASPSEKSPAGGAVCQKAAATDQAKEGVSVDSRQENRQGKPSAGEAPLSKLYDAIRREGGFIYSIHAPWSWQPAPGMTCWVFHPPAQGVPGNDNANSLVLGLEIHGRRVLLAGDLEPPGIQRVLVQPRWPCDLMLVPHHGSRKSMPAALAEWCRPHWAVISGGRLLPTKETEHHYRSAGARIVHTGRHGAILAELSPQQVRLHTQWPVQDTTAP
jgi:competence protein ComEC